MIVPTWWNELIYFRPDEQYKDGEEFKDSFPRPDKMDESFMRKLDEARRLAGVSFIITSSYREGDPLSHGKGLAVDVRAKGNWMRERIFEGMKLAGIPRRGVYDKHIHGDDDPSAPPGIWGGVSR